MEPTLFGHARTEPLAARLRPRRVEDVLGQSHLLAVGKPLRTAIEGGQVGNMILWGPPGSGKTTLARLVAHYTERHFEPFSAVTEGVPRVREVLAQAEARQQLEGRGTILFCDEIHRFNKAQQDAFLPSVESGLITLIGATTENPSFELNAALLSRVPVYVLEPLGVSDLEELLRRGLLGVGRQDLIDRIEDEARALLVRQADGDARKMLNAVEGLVEYGGERSDETAPLTADDVEQVLTRRLPRYDKTGDQHYDLISALHKAVRGSDVEGALYWLARMIAAGEDALYIARRVVRMAVEDIGLADPRGLTLALAAKDAYHFLGSPEGDLALAEAVVYLATSPKSNRVYMAWDSAMAAAREHPSAPVPFHVRNAPTKLMKDLGHGRGYRYDHEETEGIAAGQEYLPEVLRGVEWYVPKDAGFEKTVRERLDWWKEARRRAPAPEGGRDPDVMATEGDDAS